MVIFNSYVTNYQRVKKTEKHENMGDHHMGDYPLYWDIWDISGMLLGYFYYTTNGI